MVTQLCRFKSAPYNLDKFCMNIFVRLMRIQLFKHLEEQTLGVPSIKHKKGF